MELIILPSLGALLLLVALIAIVTFLSDPYQVDHEEKKAVDREYKKA